MCNEFYEELIMLIDHNMISFDCMLINEEYLEAFEPKWVNPILNIIEVNTLRPGGLRIIQRKTSLSITI